MNKNGIRAVAKFVKDSGYIDHNIEKSLGKTPNFKFVPYTEEGQVVQSVCISSSDFQMSEAEKDFSLHGYSSKPEEIEDFQYVKPIRLTTVDEIINFIKKGN